MDEIERLYSELLSAPHEESKLAILDRDPEVQQVSTEGLSPEKALVWKQFVALRRWTGLLPEEKGERETLLEPLLAVDRFYREMGGLVGYQWKILEALHQKIDRSAEAPIYHPPVFDDISEETDDCCQAIVWGLQALPSMGELYPLGGAADRLHLFDEKTQTELPAAKLPFFGRTLLEGLIRDLQAREWLYFRLFGEQITTPVAMMTSWEKENHRHVTSICEQLHWFGRPKGSFRLFAQPLVPAVDEEGRWHRISPSKLLLKPGGHGVLWKLARDEGILSWMERLGKTKVLVRQINNPLAGLDGGIFAFSGIGWKRDQWFGFASCPRLVKASEGMNVLVEKPSGGIVLTNIEYCDFAKFGMEDCPSKEGGSFSKFSSNTNILFADLGAVSQAINVLPLPGLLIHFKQGHLTAPSGEKREVQIARLESTMQNIADAFEEEKKGERALRTERTFATYNHRHKTISVAKKAYQEGKSLQETPERCFYDRLESARELLLECGFTLPPSSSPEQSLERGPSLLFDYHPALGPLYPIIRQKLRGGSFGLGSELQLEIAELDAESLHIEGSVRILAHRIMGSVQQGLLTYSTRVGRCRLKNVSFFNRGIDWTRGVPHWKMELERNESFQLELRGWSEFDAEGVSFRGVHHFVVEDGERVVVREKGGKVVIHREPMEKDHFWNYSIRKTIELRRE